ncbi:hypothetical protein G8S49_11270 [Clostridium botulinum C]|uniref:Uncharacterized protein n=2 Tax=Clostridium botulinum TaxID=1491 RepID=A0A9Q4XZN2_CLOBO|nr:MULTISPECIES: hypothetical protein [Clostridium]EGO86227.1 hypothetical protein CBCST_22970 [Clostridium botulinum C str. Stockholm]KEI08138.1 hypothetical protein Z958_p0018 [Clostridium novyi B str. NCTC 9691]MCD3195733.1 hypothetical protein [Clostridium botulinum C]MCD3201149.1 hypothetical protein [Clostridium botulinum C]MCD3206599.1 hypothetical protein [Clostridium botulinum C]
MNTIAIALLVNAAAIVTTGAVVIREIKKVNANVKTNVEVSFNNNKSLENFKRDLDVAGAKEELKNHISSEFMGLSFRGLQLNLIKPNFKEDKHE